MYILIDKKNGQIRSVSDGKIEYNKNLFELKEFPDEEYMGYAMYYKNGKIEKTKIHTPDDSKKIKKELKEATTVGELKNIIEQLINK